MKSLLISFTYEAQIKSFLLLSTYKYLKEKKKKKKKKKKKSSKWHSWEKESCQLREKKRKLH